MDRRVDVAAIEELLRERAWLERLVARLAASPADRDDLAQRTIVHALAAPARIRDPRAFLAKVARGFALNLGRERSRRELRERAASPLELATDFDPSLLAERAEMQHRVIAALLELDDPQRSILLLRFHGEETSEAIAARLSMPAPTVRSHLRRGLERLRARLDGDSSCREWRTLLVPSLGWRAGVGVSGSLVGGVLVKWKLAMIAASILVVGGVGVRLFRTEADAPHGDHGAESRSSPAVDTEPSRLEAARSEIAGDPSPSSGGSPGGGPGLEEVAVASVRGKVIREGTLAPVADVALLLPRALLPTIFRRRVAESFPASESNSPFESVEVARSASDGSFRLDDVTVGMNLPFVLQPRQELSASRPITVPEPGERALEFRIDDVAPLRGSVIDARSGDPLPGARVRVRSGRYGTSSDVLVIAADRGEFEVGVSAAVSRELVIEAEHDGYLRTLTVLPESGSLSVPLIPVARIEGVVRQPDGTPAIGASVFPFESALDPMRLPNPWIWRSDCTTKPDSRAVPVDASGRFVLEGVAPWSRVRFDISHPVHGTSERSAITSSPSETVSVDLAFDAPLGNAVIEGVLSVNGKAGPIPYKILVNRASFSGEPLRAGPDGRFRHEDVPAGEATLMVLVPGVPMKSREFDIPASGVVDASIDVEVKTSWIGGRIVRPDGTPVPNLGLTIRAKNGEWRVGLNTGANGEFRVLTALATGEEGIVRLLQEGWIKDEPIVGGDERFEFVLPESARVRLRIVDRETSTPIRNPTIRVVDPTGDRRTLQGAGVLHLPDDVIELRLGAGRHRLEIDRCQDFYTYAEVTVEATADPGLTLVEVPQARTGSLRIEFDPAAKIELPKLTLTHLWRKSGTGDPLRAIPFTAARLTRREFLVFELPVGTIDFGAMLARSNENVVLASSLVIREGETTILTMRRED